jgi:hypothetical protein
MGRIYDIYLGHAHHATLTLQADGQHLWVCVQAMQALELDGLQQDDIAREIAHNPAVAVFQYEGFTIRRRDDDAGRTHAL